MATQPHQSPMKILQRKAPSAKGEMEPKPKRKKAREAAPMEAEAFTALEQEAAEQLICLSKGSASSATARVRLVSPCTAPVGRSSSSLCSVNAPPAPPAPGAIILGSCGDWEEDEEHEVAGRQPRVKRYRLISEIYAATEPIRGCSSSSRKNKKKE